MAAANIRTVPPRSTDLRPCSNAEGAPAAPNPQLSAQVITQYWPKLSKKAAALMIAKYGPPGYLDDDRLIWCDNGPWKRTIVHREGNRGRFMTRSAAFLEQVVSYHVPLGKFTELERFDPRLAPNRSLAELSMRSESEQTNFLVLNLADEIIVGLKNAKEARRFYAQASEMSKSGRSSPYTKTLRYQMKE